MRILVLVALAASLQELPRAVPVEPVAAILDQFQSHSIVALGEVHGDLNSLKFRLELIRDPRFAETVNDIVVEAGNARYQDVVDRYVRGEEVPAASVREAVRNTTNHDWQVDTPTFEEIFHAVRALNLTLPADKRLRILLGDPPFDWTAVKSVHDLYRSDRDRFVADLVLKESMARKRRALIVYGHMHFRRGDQRSIVTYLESAGHKVFSIASLTPGAVMVGQSDVYSWPLPRLALIRGTVLGGAELPAWHPLPLERQVDAVLIDTMAPSSVPREFCDDPDYMKMRLFRMDLRGQGDQLRRYCGMAKW